MPALPFDLSPAAQSSVPEQEREPNRLIHEKSPYLLQHARNPVDWYPWGEEAFSKARKESKPIFLSIGYSTCNWCHVMARESFSNPQIAAIMNQHFVSIKVDREERPDVDQIYMAFVQASTGSGGWPMSVLVTPELEPFFGGTYLPPKTFENLLLKVADEWQNNREAILLSAGRITDQLRASGDVQGDGDLKLEKELLDRTYEWYKANYDSAQGGFGGAPKFPRPVNFNFLLRYHDRTGQKMALEMTVRTLKKMAQGGIHDHIGGGFHRYSTDNRWFLPHFEKMLYDQAQLASSYLDAYQISGDPLFQEVARGIFDYVLRDMTGEEGGFYSAEDADSAISHEHPDEHVEGAFYVWTYQQIVELLGEAATPFSDYYGVQKDGNVERDVFGDFKEKNLLFVSATAGTLSQSQEEMKDVFEKSREKLLKARERRPRPGLDDKVLTAWNGLMISSLARGYQVLQEEKYLRAAERAATLITEKLYDRQTGRLKRRYREGEAAIDGLVDDYAFFIQGLLDLYETSLDGRWLILAMELTETQNRLFWDSDNGGFYSTTGEDPSILIRMKEDYDGAEPSPNSIAVLNLLRLSQMTGNKTWREMAQRSIQAFERRLLSTPHAMPQMMAAVNFYLDKPKQILIAGQRNSPDTKAILREVHKRFIPNKILVLADGGPAHQRLNASLEILDSLRQVDGKATAYICEDYVCKLPTNDVAVVARLLDE
ncbi:MAG: thioredoxin domain-containing protein [Acidobacteria bacterium]|nr:thioredoxin domain-containing protein [Acidobacteriota bacterium]